MIIIFLLFWILIEKGKKERGKRKKKKPEANLVSQALPGNQHLPTHPAIFPAATGVFFRPLLPEMFSFGRFTRHFRHFRHTPSTPCGLRGSGRAGEVISDLAKGSIKIITFIAENRPLGSPQDKWLVTSRDGGAVMVGFGGLVILVGVVVQGRKYDNGGIRVRIG